MFLVFSNIIKRSQLLPLKEAVLAKAQIVFIIKLTTASPNFLIAAPPGSLIGLGSGAE